MLYIYTCSIVSHPVATSCTEERPGISCTESGKHVSGLTSCPARASLMHRHNNGFSSRLKVEKSCIRTSLLTEWLTANTWNQWLFIEERLFKTILMSLRLFQTSPVVKLQTELSECCTSTGWDKVMCLTLFLSAMLTSFHTSTDLSGCVVCFCGSCLRLPIVTGSRHWSCVGKGLKCTELLPSC